MKELIAAKLEVMKEVRRVEKTRRMQGAGNYQYAGLEEIIAEVRPAMVKHGLTITPVKNEPVHIGTLALKSGGQMNRTIEKVTFRLEHVSGQAQEIETTGESADAGDKSCNKCMTAALKYALLQTFLLQGAHDDPDDYRPEDDQRGRRQQQAPPPPDPAKSRAEADALVAAFAKAGHWT